MLTSFKTTLVGVGLAFLNLYGNGMTPKNAAISIGLGLLGALSKDFNVSGSSK